MKPFTDNKQVFYNKAQWYSVTINPSDKYQYHGKEDRIKKFRNFMYETFLQLDSYKIQYKFNIELSEPKEIKPGTTGSRLHLHGRIMFTCNYSIMQFLLHVQYAWSRIAYVDIDTIEDIEIWDTYCTKQQHIFKGIKTELSNAYPSDSNTA